MYDSWYNNHKILLVLTFSNRFFFCLFCAFNITGDTKKFVQISLLLNKTKIVEIWTKFFISPMILKAQKKQTTFGKCQDFGYFGIINSKFRFANNYRKLFQGLMTALNSYCYQHVSWADAELQPSSVRGG